MTEEFFSHSGYDTCRIARQFAASLKPGEIISLTGELGAGKTLFMRGVTEFFNCDEQLSSPTFSLFNIYKGSLEGEEVVLHHFDLYRIESLRELEAIGFDEYLSSGDFSFVEWAERFPESSSLYTVAVSLEYAGDESRRIIIKRSVR
ncbi:MAG: tRNA (adenosine(37)-N6)-threonylcarbamoyltransferase complex ATPase subunit type 1 TsaE [Chlorobium sp.]|nr:MAG: tRNA (adenosine(37)-N6)-threonylcarbamoyltransferase complex ATPase subunit type 1 TsaE [Chlorobium sp.]